MLKVQCLAPRRLVAEWTPHLEAAFDEAGITASLGTDFAPETVDYVIYAPGKGAADLSDYTRTKAVLGLWAGTAAILAAAALAGNLLLAGVPDVVLALIRSLAGGAVVASLATEVFPKAFKDGSMTAGVAAAMGLVLAIALDQLG